MRLFKKQRPYREVSLPSLIAWRDSLIADIHWNMEEGGVPLSDVRRRELDRIVHELNCRSEETK